VVIALSGAVLFRTLKSSSGKIDYLLFEAVGEEIATQAIRAAGQRGKIVVLDYSGSPSQTSSSHAAIRRGFLQALRQKSDVQVLANVTIPWTEDHPMATTEGFPGQTFISVLVKYFSVNAIVSLAGVPRLDDDEVNQLPSSRPPFIGFVPALVPMRNLLSAGVIQVAIMPRIPAADEPKEPHTKSEWFRKCYRIETPLTADTLSE